MMATSSTARKLLAPLTPLYRLGLALREQRLASGREPVQRLRSPVISIGNLSTGGAGKTPLTVALARALRGQGLAVDVLSRGYGRRSRLPARVRVDGTAEEFGDEPLLIAHEADVPVYVAARRYEAGAMAEARAATCAVHLLDDGFQHRQLHRDIDILLLNGGDWQDRLLPAGNLREPLQAIRRASVIAIPENEPELEPELRRWGWMGQVWRLRRHIQVPPLDGPAVAFCGIARPEQFFANLEAAGVQLVARFAFPDHHRYTERDIRSLTNALQRCRAASLLTTAKDAVRLGERGGALPLGTVILRTEIDDERAALGWLMTQLNLIPSEPPV